MKEIGAQVLVKTVKGLAEGTLKERPQSSIVNPSPVAQDELSIEKTQSSETHSPLTIHHSLIKHAPKIFTETCKIDFTKTTAEVHNLIRGLSPFPGAFTELNGKMLKIYRSEKEITTIMINPGFHETDGKTFLKFACADGYVHVKELQLEGKKKMNVEDFLRGYHFV
jgi:methionyl-tRNA formyltransferase